MRAYQLMLVLAFLGSVSGAIEGTMAYGVAHGEQDWFAGQVDYIDFQDEYMVVQEDQLVNMKDTSDMGATELAIKEFGAVGIMLNSIYRIVYIGDIIADLFEVPDPANPSVNLFGPFALMIQLGIWSVYGMGVLQVWRQQGFKGAY